MAKRKFIDWDSIEPLYRGGALSIYKICDQYEADHVNSGVWKTTVTHAAIIKKAKEKKWTRDLAGKVKNRINEKLVTNLVTNSNKDKRFSDNDIIEHAAEAGSQVVFRHREEIKVLLRHEDELLKELLQGPKKLYLSTFQGEILSKEVDLTVTEKSTTLKNLAAVRAQRIALERQAHNLDDKSSQDEPAKNLSDEILDANIRALARKFNK